MLAASGQLLHKLAGHDGWVYSVAYSSDGRKLASASADKTVIIWNIPNYKEIVNSIDVAQALDMCNQLAQSPGSLPDEVQKLLKKINHE